jgi:hypothetical protein
LLRPYRGLGGIIDTWPRYYNQYDAINISYNRPFRRGLQIGANYTLGLRNRGNMLSPPRLVHNSDGSFGFRSDQSQVDDLLGNVGLRRHTIKAYWVAEIPHIKMPKAASLVANGWQISGVLTAGTGAPYDATYSYQGGIGNINLTGSPNYAARIKVVGDPGSGCSSDPYKQLNAAAFSGPTYNSVGNESGASLFHGCFDHTIDLAIARNIRLGSEKRVLQIRGDAFNVFNAVVINARQTQFQLANPSNPTAVVNNQFNADGSLNSARLTPATAGFGSATGAQNMRSIQLQFRFIF